MASVTVNKVKLNYIEQGGGDEAIVFVHGYSGALGAWGTALERLPEKYHAYALDQRGHGQSERADSYQLADFVKDIYAFSQELGIGPFTYVGWSLGGKVGYQFALQYPDLLKAIVLVDPAPAHDFISPDERAGFVTQMSSLFGSPEMLRGFLPSQFAEPPSEEFANQVIDDAMAADPVAREETAHWWVSANLEPQLGDIKVPALLVAGAQSPIPLDWQKRYVSAIEGSRLELLQDAGHFVPYESPRKFVNLLTSFIKEMSNG